MKKNILKRLLILMFPIIFIGCSGNKTEQDIYENSKVRYKKDFIIALIPERNVFEQRKRHKPLCEYLSESLNMNVIIRTLPNYGFVYDEFKNDKVDGAFFGSFTYVLTHNKVNAEVLARPVWQNGSSTYCGYLFARKNSRIKNIMDMKGKTLVLVDKSTTAGYLFPLMYFKENGINNIKKHFKKVFYAGSHDAAVLSVLNGEADIGAAKNDLFDNLIKTNVEIKNNLIILAKSKEVPSNALAVRYNLEEGLKIKIKDALLNMDKTPEGIRALEILGAKKIIVTTDMDYKEVNSMIKYLNINLMEFPYTHTLEE